MNFFKSILADDPEPTKSEKPHGSDSDSSDERQHHEDDDRSNQNDVAEEDSAGAWSFGGLMKTIATRSESVIETYRKDLQEFSSGLKKETEIVREVASRAVKDLPTSLEAGASAAQGALDGVLKSTAEIISKESIFFGSDGEPETPETNQSRNSARYSWFESQLSVVQSDQGTFCDEPEDLEEYKKWRLEFNLEEKSDEIEDLIGENGVMEGIYARVVPSVVDDETFWLRYFYRVDKLKQQEKVRANLVKRAISVDDDEELSWDVDDDEEEEVSKSEHVSEVKAEGGNEVGDKGMSDESTNLVGKLEGSSNEENERGDLNLDGDDKDEVEVPKDNVDEKVSVGTGDVKSEEVVGVKSDEKVKAEEAVSENSSKKSSEAVPTNEVTLTQVKSDEKVKSEESVEEKNGEKVVEKKGKPDIKTDAAAVSSNQSKVDEEDMGWDEIENIGSDDEKKVPATSSGSPNRADLRRRLSVADDDDEDLSWDIEDDEEPVKA